MYMNVVKVLIDNVDFFFLGGGVDKICMGIIFNLVFLF